MLYDGMLGVFQVAGVALGVTCQLTLCLTGIRVPEQRQRLLYPSTLLHLHLVVSVSEHQVAQSAGGRLLDLQTGVA